MSGSVCWRLLLSVGFSSSLEMSGGVYEGCLGGFLGYKNGFHGHRRHLDVFVEYLGSQSLQYGATTLSWQNPERHNFSSPGRIETSKYQNVHI